MFQLQTLCRSGMHFPSIQCSSQPLCLFSWIHFWDHVYSRRLQSSVTRYPWSFFNQYSINISIVTRSTLDKHLSQQSVESWLICDQVSINAYQLVNTCPTIDWLSIKCWSSVNQVLLKCWSSVHQVLTKCQSSADQVSIKCWSWLVLIKCQSRVNQVSVYMYVDQVLIKISSEC